MAQTKKILLSPEKYGCLDLGFAAFFLNRTNRSGILKGGVIGGKYQNGAWRLDVRYNKENLIKRICKIANHASSISVYCEDAIVNISRLNQVLPENTLIYLDPPYYEKGKNLYRSFYKHDDHVKIKEILGVLKNIKWLVSYDNVPQVRKLYESYKSIEYSLRYVAQVKKQGSEILFFDEKIAVPASLLFLS